MYWAGNIDDFRQVAPSSKKQKILPGFVFLKKNKSSILDLFFNVELEKRHGTLEVQYPCRRRNHGIRFRRPLLARLSIDGVADASLDILRRWNLDSAKIHFFSKKWTILEIHRTSVLHLLFFEKTDFCEKQWILRETIDSCKSNELLLSYN